jgi:flagellar hook-associated protein 3 FlgL
MSTAFRITQGSISRTVLAGLQGNLSRLGETQQRLSSGKLITRASDSPTGTVSAMRFRSEISATDQYSRNAYDGLGWLATVDSSLTSIVDQTHRVRELVLQGMSSGTGGSAEARAAIAAEIDGIRQSMIGGANTTYVGRPVFGGTTAGTTAYAADGTYVGDAGSVVRTVGDNTRVRVDSAGTDVFGTGPTQLFTVLTDIANDLRTNQAGLSADLGRLDTARGALQAGLSSVGARYNQVEKMRQAADDKALSLASHLSDVEDVDLPKTLTDLQLQQTAYQAALAAGARIVQPSLLDFLR